MPSQPSCDHPIRSSRAGEAGCRVPGLGLAATLLAVAALAAPAAAQTSRPMHFESYSLEDGLSQSDVLFILQDSYGFIWMGTQDGLNRFDGYRFHVYKNDPSDQQSLADDFVWAGGEDENGDLWLATRAGGIARWERRSDRFVRYQHVPGDARTLATNRTRTIAVDLRGAIWVGTLGDGLDRLDPETGEATHFRNDPADPHSLSDDRVYSLWASSPGTLWVGTDGGLNRLDPETGRAERFVHHPDDPNSLSDDHARVVREDSSGAVWVGTRGGGLNRLDPETGTFTRFRNDARRADSLSSDWVQAIYEDDAGRIWIGTSAGLDLLDPARGSFVRYKHDPANPYSLADSSVRVLCQDRGGVLWVGTQFGGVSKWHPMTWSFGHHDAASSGLSGDNISAFTEDAAGGLWIGTFGSGLNRLDRGTGTVARYRHDPSDRNSLSQDRVMALLPDGEDGIWIGTYARGLNHLDVSSGRFRHWRERPGTDGALSDDGVTTLVSDRRGGLWVGTFEGGLNHYDPDTGRFTSYRADETDPQSLSTDAVMAIALDPAGVLWIGTLGGGLNRFDPESGRFTRFRNRPDDPTSLSSDTVYGLHVDGAGTLWVGTGGGGLDRVVVDDAGGVSFRTFSERDGLASDVVYGALSDTSGHLWLSTNDGLSRFDPRSGSFQNYDLSHGLQGNEFNSGAYYRSRSGELFFGGPGGFNAFFPDRLEVNRHLPPVALTAFLKFNRPAESGEPPHSLQQIELGYRDDVVTFEFAALDFAAPRQNRYAYKLEGFEPNWIESEETRRVTYTNLGPGHYLLRVKAANNDGLWNEQGLSLPIEVAPPPWRTWWAYALYAFALGAAGIALVRTQQRKALRQAEYRQQLEREVAARTQELRERNAELLELNVKLSEASLTDSLTGLRNRRFLFEEIARDAALIQRGSIRGERVAHLAFIMIDLDSFKPINDTLGHAAGDRVLLQVRDLLEQACRTSDVLIRWGGDEFLVVGRDAEPQQIGIVPERIRTTIEQHSFDIGEGREARLTCSIGVAIYPFLPAHPDAVNLDNVVALADKALYVAKNSGRNAWVCFLASEQAGPEAVPAVGSRGTPRLVGDGLLEVRSSVATETQLVYD